jgi:hypothetical protein
MPDLSSNLNQQMALALATPVTQAASATATPVTQAATPTPPPQTVLATPETVLAMAPPATPATATPVARRPRPLTPSLIYQSFGWTSRTRTSSASKRC